ncbi:MAG TPA: hypothetical protein VMV01_01715 [Planctomycetota bacterium]|nr:hypothetical protein [Planctomycetota bacterium]
MRLPALVPFVLGLALTLAGPASAQFSQFAWTLDDSQGGVANLTAQEMLLAGDGSFFSGAEIQFTTSSDVAGRVRLHAILMPFDGVCSGSAFFIHGTSKSDYATCYFNDDLQFDVTQGQTFGFGLKTGSLSFPFTNYLSAFEFSPYWRDLGGSLAGSLGAPALAGSGIVQPGHVVGLSLAGAAPAAPAALIVGFSPLFAPFKGGVLVPSPDLVIAGLATGPAGALSFSATLPATVPVGFTFLAQFWVVDAGGPAGFAASNGVVAQVLP